MYRTNYDSPIGELTLASDGNNLIGLWMVGQKYYGSTVNSNLIDEPNLPIFIKTKEWLDRYFSGANPSISDIPLKPNGGEFRQSVWKMLCEIPYGGVTTYGNLAKELAIKMNKKSMSAQAVGGAVGHNPIAIIIPCHRVIGSNGKLTGFAGGLDKKTKLLDIESNDNK